MKTKAGTPAADRVLGTARIRVEAETNALISGPDYAVKAELAHAEKIEAAACATLPEGTYETAVGGELVPRPSAVALPATYKDTMKTPSLVTAEASRARLDLANDAGVLESALNLCDTIQASNDAERMLASEMALLHKLTMKTGALALETAERMAGVIDERHRETRSVQLARLVNSATRASVTYQSCMETLQKCRTGGKQIITVTHVQNTQVNEGGQAVVTGGMGSNLGGRTSENG